MACAVGPSVNPFQNKGNATYDYYFFAAVRFMI